MKKRVFRSSMLILTVLSAAALTGCGDVTVVDSDTFEDESDGGKTGIDGGLQGDGGVEEDGGVQTDGGSDKDGGTVKDGGTTQDGGTVKDGGTAQDGGSVKDGGTAQDGGTVKDGGTAQDGGAAQDGGTTVDGGTLDYFSFFVTSLAAIRDLSQNQDGFGGDLRYGFTGQGAGLKGADKICSDIAERSMPGSSIKQWRAFLSVTADENGKQVNAIDRIGNGPWYDRLGRLFASSKANLLYDRPYGINATIKNDLPNEDGVPNHRPDPTQPQVDNHDMLTGSNEDGQLYSSTATCKDWTSNAGTSGEGKPRIGHSWPRSGALISAGSENPSNWMSAHDVEGCGAGVNLTNSMSSEKIVGGMGGYGGFYCFALTP